MSWSFSAVGTKAKLLEALDEQSKRETGQCKIEFDGALPHLKGLISENFTSGEYRKKYNAQEPLIEVDVCGSGSSEGDTQMQRSLTINCLRPVWRKVLVSIALLLGVFISGCSVSPDQINKTIDTAGPPLLYDIILEEPNAEAAKKAAQFTSTAISTDILPFVQNSQLPAAQLIPQLRKMLGQKLTDNKWFGGALSIISLATSLGNIDIKAPAMSDVERQYIIHSLTAIQKACDGYTSGKGITKAFKLKSDGSCEIVDIKEHKPDTRRVCSLNACKNSLLASDILSKIEVLEKKEPVKPVETTNAKKCTDGECRADWKSNSKKAEVVSSPDVVVDESGQILSPTAGHVAGYNPKGADIMVLDGIEYGRSTNEFVPDVIVDGDPYCQIGKRRVSKSEAVQTLYSGRTGSQ